MFVILYLFVALFVFILAWLLPCENCNKVKYAVKAVIVSLLWPVLFALLVACLFAEEKQFNDE